MKYLKYVFYTLLVVLFNLIILLFLSKNFRNNFFEYLDAMNYRAQLLGKSVYESIYKSENADSIQSTETEDSALQSSQKTNIKYLSSSLTRKNNIPNKLSLGKLDTNHVSETLTQKQNDKQDNNHFKIVDNDVNLLSGSNGFIFIESIPERVSVFIEEREIGKTPLTLRVDPPGLYKIVLRSKNYETWEKTVHVHPSEVTKINAKLRTGSSTLTILSDPQLADIRIDGDFKGKTPLTIKPINAGIHHIYISKGNKEYEGSIEILSEKNKVINVKLKILRALVNVDSEPKGANIYIDGVKVGMTPAKLKDVKIGHHQIVLVKEESLAFVDSINVYPDKENTIFAELIDKIHFKDTFSATLKIDSELDEAIVRIDGKTRGIIPLFLNYIRTGEHEIFIVKSDFKGTYYYSTKFSINPYETKKIYVMNTDFKFKKRFN